MGSIVSLGSVQRYANENPLRCRKFDEAKAIYLDAEKPFYRFNIQVLGRIRFGAIEFDDKVARFRINYGPLQSFKFIFIIEISELC